MFMPCKMTTSMLALVLPATFAQACQRPARAEIPGASCTEPLAIINRADSFIITRRSAPEADASPRPATFLRLAPHKLGSNIRLDSAMPDPNRPSSPLPPENEEQGK